MAQDLTEIQSMYDKVAKEWAKAFLNEHDNKPKDQEILLRFSKLVGDKKSIWDFGCGPGNTASLLKNLGIEISGLDLSEKILEQARTIHPGIHFQKGNILDLEFKNNSIAGVVAFYAIIHFTQEQVMTAFREIFRVLNPGGIFLLTYHIGNDTIHLHEFLGKEIDIDFMFFSNDFISTSLKSAGFENIDIIEREPYPKVEYQSQRAYVFAMKPAAP